jgi:hypothetical protein
LKLVDHTYLEVSTESAIARPIVSTYETLRALRALLFALENAAGLRQSLARLSEHHVALLPHLFNWVNQGAGTAPFKETAGQVNQVLAAAKKTLAEWTPQEIFDERKDLVGLLTQIRWPGELSFAPREVVRSAIEDVMAEYNVYINRPATPRLLSLMASARRFTDEFGSAEATARSIVAVLEGARTSVEEGEAVIELVLFGDVDFAGLLPQDRTFRPLRLRSVADGSYLIEFSGDNVIMTMMGMALWNAGLFFYRRKTPEGRLDAIPGHAKLLNTMIDILGKLDALGTDTPAKRLLHRAATTICNQLDKLFDNVSRVDLNGVTIPVETTGEIENRTTRALPPGETPMIEPPAHDPDEGEAP